MSDVDKLILEGTLDYVKNLTEKKENKMTIEEVLKALVDGKTVKAECGVMCFYLKIQDGTILHSSLEEGGGSKGFSFGPEYTYSIYEPPKEKKRYWAWKIKVGGYWYRNLNYMDDNGFRSDGSMHHLNTAWNEMEKIKIEDDFIDV